MSVDIGTLMRGVPVMAIFRSMPADHAVELAHKAWDLGIDLVEVPIQTPDAVPALEAVIAAGHQRGKLVGSGTITTEDQVRLSQRLGVAFTVAPGLDREVVAVSRQLGLPHLPGVASASEIQKAVRLGCDWVKAFPAAVLGADWFRAMKGGPFPGVSFVATGGLNASNAAAFLDAGASTVAVGSALADPRQVDMLAALVRPSGTP